MKKNEFLHLSDKLDILDDRMDDIEKVLVLQEANLKEHMKRTAILEQQVMPLTKFMHSAYGIIGFITFLAAIAAAYSIFK
jgi:hypothetical protein